MDARTPPLLRLEDLDREELLQLLANRPVPYSHFTPFDLASARWDVALRRCSAARAEEEPIRQAYYAVAFGRDRTGMSERAWSAWQKDREAKRLAAETAARRTKRAEAAEDRAWKALNALSVRSA